MARIYQFDRFRLEIESRQLLMDGKPVPLAPKVFDTLVLLVEHHGRLVSKRELMAALWPDVAVEEVNLARNISDLRKALGESASLIQTAPKHGYRFVGEVRGDAPATPSPQSRKNAVWAAAAIFALIVPAGGWWLSRRDAPVRSIAVLPFRHLDAGSADDALEIGLADSLITRFSGISDLVVRPSSATWRFTGKDQDPIAIGRQLQVDAILEGNLQREDGLLRVSVRLLRVRDGRALWSGSSTERWDQAFRVQEAIAGQFATAMTLRLGRSRVPPGGTTASSEAYRAYVQGRMFWNRRTREGLTKAIDAFRQAVAADPSYALAHSGLADAHLMFAGYSLAPQDEHIPRARDAAAQALRLDPSLAAPHATLGLLAQNYSLDWEEAEREHRLAILLDPNYSTARHWYGELLSALGRFREAEAQLARAHELDPTSAIILADWSKMHLFAREWAKAVERAEAAVALDPGSFLAHYLLSATRLGQGRCREAEESNRRAVALGNGWFERVEAGWIDARCGRRGEAEKIASEMTDRAQTEYVSPMAFAMLYASLGDADRTFSWMEKSLDERVPGISALQQLFVFDPVRADPRFPAMVARLKLNGGSAGRP